MSFACCETPMSSFGASPANHTPQVLYQAYHGASQSNLVQGIPSSTSLNVPPSDGLERSHSQRGLSFIPTASPRSEPAAARSSSQHRRCADRGSVYISPFRSVRRMRRPFPLVLPTSPSFDSGGFNHRDPNSARSSNGLQTLRAWRSDQNLVSANKETFGLLPSPPLTDPKSTVATPKMEDFSAHHAPEKDPQSEPLQSRYSVDSSELEMEDLHSIHIAMGTQVVAGEITSVHLAHSSMAGREPVEDQAVTDSERVMPIMASQASQSARSAVCAHDTQERTAFEGLRPENRPRNDTVSSESSTWRPSNLTYCEQWLQGVREGHQNRGAERPTDANRRFQIVEKNLTHPSRDEEARLAVASKTKPKLVDISRQSANTVGQSSSIHSRDVPQTPKQRPVEVSAFSPETPLGTSDSGYMSQYSHFAEHYYDDHDEDYYTDSDSVDSSSNTTTLVCPGPIVHSERVSSLRKPTVDLTVKSPGKVFSPTCSSLQSENISLQKLWDQEWTLKQLDHAVKDFPRTMLRLTSPVIMFLRHSDEKSLLRHFRKVFPDVSETLLCALCAALIALNYVDSLATPQRDIGSGLAYCTDPSRLQIVPEKARTTLGIQYLNASPLQIPDPVLGSSSLELRRSLDGIINKLLFAICGRSDDLLKSAVTVIVQVLETKSSPETMIP